MKRTEFLENELAEAKFEIISLSCRVTRAEDLSRDLDDNIEDLKAENERHRNKIKSLELLLENRNKIIEQLNEDIREMSDDNDELMYKFDNALLRISELEGRLSER